ncbi:MAG: right-handed parallel beta-helix repeat-containing protein [Prevotellaceae bacterium]|jgi:hypothetical protein|nr:right-handed parallel beta-helix repeat-containing protein [Prevotellaceae bacterium]
MKKYITFLTICFVASFAFATNITVNSNASLLSAISGTADTVYINGTIVTAAEILINRNIVFIGINNGTLDGNNSHRIFLISGLINKSIFDNLTFINGNCDDISGSGGGAIANDGDTIIIRNSLFQNNRKTALCSESSVYFEIYNTIFNSNEGSAGGAVAYWAYNSSGLMRNCVFSNNSAHFENYSYGFGGAIYAINGSSHENLIIIDCSFYNNSADGYGNGGIIMAIGINLTIINSVFHNNYGGIGNIYLTGVKCKIINSTITKNTGYTRGGIIMTHYSVLDIYNSVITGNSHNFNETEIYADITTGDAPYNNILNMYNSIYYATDVSPTININNFSGVSPSSVFVNYANNNFHLLQNSVAVNNGNDAYYVNGWNTTFPSNTITSPRVHTDIEGNNRLQACQIDMGAYESPYFPQKNTTASFCEGKTYDFNGRILTNAGVYYDTISNVDCDTVIKLTLRQLDIVRYNYRDTSYKCEWYYFGTDSLNETGIYVDTLTARNGCDSIVTLDLLVRPREFDDTLNICVEKLPVTVYDTVFSRSAMSGTYIIHHRCATITFLLNVLPKPQTLPPQIPEICADDESFVLKLPPTNHTYETYPTSYEIVFNNKALSAGFVNQSGEFYGGNEITVEMPQSIRPNPYSCKIILTDTTSICTSQVFDIEFDVLYSHMIIEQNWNDVLALLNSRYNGGYKFSFYEWYLDGTQLAGENNSFIYIKNGGTLKMGHEYRVLLTREGESNRVFTCPLIPQWYTDITAYPTIVGASTRFSIVSKNAVNATLYTVTGIKLSEYRLLVGEENSIYAPRLAGVYIIVFEDKNGRTEAGKIVVK